ncbi:hypothetical protein Tcan_00243 [Toxocara canis]|uniref:Uncharacterized protein n=1 Tax=Toxocara canis TaxID=6265 RepID=A0A0B2V3Z8_TOXCA|nr:hypothetical protein Tcan_00243 [Toxocara canis]
MSICEAVRTNISLRNRTVDRPTNGRLNSSYKHNRKSAIVFELSAMVSTGRMGFCGICQKFSQIMLNALLRKICSHLTPHLIVPPIVRTLFKRADMHTSGRMDDQTNKGIFNTYEIHFLSIGYSCLSQKFATFHGYQLLVMERPEEYLPTHTSPFPFPANLGGL